MFNGESRVADKFVVRLPGGMRERIADIARGNNRSMNSEIVYRLEESIDTDYSDSADIEHNQLSKEEKEMVASARKLTAPKRKALLILLASDQ